MAHNQRADPLLETGKYERVKQLGSGSFGFVLLAKNIKTGELVAIKFLQRSSIDRRYVERELLNHSILVHPHGVWVDWVGLGHL